MESFDVTSLYINVSKGDTMQAVHEILVEYEVQLALFGLDIAQIMVLIDECLQCNIMKWSNQYCRQIPQLPVKELFSSFMYVLAGLVRLPFAGPSLLFLFMLAELQTYQQPLLNAFCHFRRPNRKTRKADDTSIPEVSKDGADLVMTSRESDVVESEVSVAVAGSVSSFKVRKLALASTLRKRRSNVHIVSSTSTRSDREGHLLMEANSIKRERRDMSSNEVEDDSNSSSQVDSDEEAQRDDSVSQTSEPDAGATNDSGSKTREESSGGASYCDKRQESAHRGG
ncbi:unnamed protein product [Heligmosomoides polygyrus]|uniref:Reverse transcriptase domain-containing protein n=1 Tax=Heligmosomoides polygyrus TaxID=6339 RepID=A0A183FK35_HELPZ|nr:unnamed protein product [Heligmosomoides polygyrus]